MGIAALLGGVHRDLEPAFIERIRAARRADPAAPVTVLVGSNLLAAYLARRAAEALGGLFNVRFVTFSDLFSALAPAGAVSLPSSAGLVILEDLLAGQSGRGAFGEAASMRGFAPTLLRTFDDLSEGGCTADMARDLARNRGGMTGEALALFADYRERIESLGGDAQALAETALEAPTPESLGSPILAYGFYDFNETQWRLLERLASQAGLEMFVPWRDAEGYRFIGPTVRRLESAGAAIEKRSADEPRGKLAILNLPGEEEEVREIARRILTLARDDSLRFNEIAVIVPSVEGYAPLVRETLDEAGIPWFAGSADIGQPNRAARSAASLVDLLCGPMERRELVEFLSAAPLDRVENEDVVGDPVSLWVRRSAEAGIIGEGGWVEEAGDLVRRLESNVEKGKKEFHALAAARRVEMTIRWITKAREEVLSARAWTAVAGSCAGALRDLLPPAPERDEACRALEDLGALDRLGVGVSTESFLRAAQRELEGIGAKRGRFGGGVSLLTFGQARCLGFRAVFVPGLAERIFPTPARQDPFLADRERAELAAASKGVVRLPARAERIAEEALLFSLALESASSEIVLSYPRFEQGTGKERIPSSFLRFASRDSGKTSGGPGAQRIARGTALERGMELVSLSELDFERCRLPKKRGGAPPDDLLFTRAADLVRGRWGSGSFTQYDGVFQSKRARNEMRLFQEERANRFSATGLERYAACPFDYLVRNVFGMEELEEPERVVTISPMDHGSFVHGILAHLYTELKSEGLLPVGGAPAARVDEIVRAVTERELAEAPGQLAVGLPVFWELEKRLVREAIRLFLEEERLEEEGFVPQEFERPFGSGKDREIVSYAGAGRTIYFHGWIDRIDSAPDGRFRIIDYKTGRLLAENQDLAGGTCLQLPVYLLAASRILDRPIEKGEALLRHVGISPDRSPVRFLGSRWSECEDELSRIIEVVTSGIEDGLFFAPASDELCRNCAVAIACSAGMERLYERKAAADLRVLRWRAMRGMIEEEGEGGET